MLQADVTCTLKKIIWLLLKATQFLIQWGGGKVSFEKMIGWKKRTLPFFISRVVGYRKGEFFIFEPLILKYNIYRLFQGIKKLPCFEEKQTSFLRVWASSFPTQTGMRKYLSSNISCTIVEWHEASITFLPDLPKEYKQIFRRPFSSQQRRHTHANVLGCTSSPVH